MDLSIDIGTLKLKNPITLASGTAGYGEELSKFINLSKLGALFTKGLSLEPRPGNRGNRILETPSGMLNSIGLENVGLQAFLDDKLPFLIEQNATIIPNVAGHSIDENVELCKVLSEQNNIDAIELNVSCPNVKEGGIAFSNDEKTFRKLIEKVRKVTKCNLIVKLSPNVTDISSHAIISEEMGADAVSAVNTYLGMKIDINTGKPHFKNKVAGLSGPAIKPMAIRAVYQVYEKTNIPIIGMGGIASSEDVIEFIMAGSSAISIGTMNLIDPLISKSILNDLENHIKTKNINSLNELIGFAHKI